MSSIHASCVSFGEVGVLIRGAPASGKSSLCLRLIDDEGRGVGRKALQARLVADDQVMISRKGKGIWAEAPPSLAGLLEVRGLGLVKVAFAKCAEIKLVVDLVPGPQVARVPEPQQQRVEIDGVMLPWLQLDARTAVAAAVLRAALGHFNLLSGR